MKNIALAFSSIIHKNSENKEPITCNNTIYEDSCFKINRLWKWNAEFIESDNETGFIKVFFKGKSSDFNRTCTYVTLDGKRLTDYNFDYMESFKEGVAVIGFCGQGYGYIDTAGKIVIPTKYEYAGNFNCGRAKVIKNGKLYFIDKSGNETPMETVSGKNYEEVCDFHEGLCRVSTLKLRCRDLAYHSDYEQIAGIWGYIDKNYNEVIPAQYIYANDFNDGIAIVCKGKWTRDKKWDNQYKSDRYWTEEELWGAVDKTGKEVIPCIFDEIKTFYDITNVYTAHFGGWDNGKWGVVDRNGKWVAKPIFSNIGYEYQDGLFTFYTDNEYGYDDDILFGIYDIKQQKVLFEPQFSDVNFLSNGNIHVNVYDKALKRNIEKIIDKNGNVILSYKHALPWEAIFCGKKLTIYNRGQKQGLMDLDGNIITPAVYSEIRGINNPLITVCDGGKDNCLEGLIKHDGTKVIKPKYRFISWYKEKYILCSNNGECEILQYVRKDG